MAPGRAKKSCRILERKQKPNFPQVFGYTGIDNPLNDTAFVFGGGVRWNESDLKYLLGSLPVK